MSTITPPVDQALFFAELGHPVISLHGVAMDGRCTCGKADCPSPAKHPFHFSKRGAHSAITCADTIRRWFEERPRINYGVALGRLFVVDIDTRNGGVASWKQLIAGKELAPTWRARTGGGGWHVFYSRPASDVPHFKPLPGIDIKCGAGAYVVGVGCKHYTGGVYAWDTLWHPHKVPLALPPDWLLEVLSPPKGAKPIEHYREIAATPLKNGERNTRLAQLFAHLYANLINPDDELILEIAQGWNLGRGDPPMDPDEVEHEIAGIALREYRKRGL